MSDEDTPIEERLGQHETKRRNVLKSLAAGGLAAGGIGAGFVGSAAADSPNAPERFEEDLSGQTLDNECTDEEMVITSGTALYRFQEFESGPDGCILHINGTANVQNVRLEGIESGQTYVGSGVNQYHVTANTCDGAPVSARERLTTKVVSPGSADNLTLTLVSKFTVNANGDPIIDTLVEDTECR